MVFFVLSIPSSTAETKNSLNTEMEASGDPGQYTHITVLQDLRAPGMDTLRLLSTIQPGEGDSDFFDAITVAMDLVAKASAERAMEKLPKKITLISSFIKAVRPSGFDGKQRLGRGQFPEPFQTLFPFIPQAKEVDEDFLSEIIGVMKAQNTALQVICLEDSQGGNSSAAKAQRASNLELLQDVIKEAGGKEIR